MPTPPLDPSTAPLPEPVQADLRDERRRRVDRAPLGRVTLLAHRERQQVHLIRDVSAHGVSLVLEHPVEPGEPVLIEQDPSPLLPCEATRNDAAPPCSPLGDPAERGDCVYRAYVVWCRDVEPARSAPDAHFVAGLRVYGPQSLEQLIEPPGDEG